MQPGSLAEWFGALAEGCGALAGCLAAMATTLAVVVALFSEPLKEWARRAVQRRKEVRIVDKSEIRQQHQDKDLLKTRLKVRNNGPLPDYFKVYVMEIVQRGDFIEVPLVWLHGWAKGEESATTREIGADESAWVDLVTVLPRYRDQDGAFLLLDIGAGAGAENLERLSPGQTELRLRIDPRHGKSVDYRVVVDWDGKWKHPRVSYTKAAS